MRIDQKLGEDFLRSILRSSLVATAKGLPATMILVSLLPHADERHAKPNIDQLFGKSLRLTPESQESRARHLTVVPRCCARRDRDINSGQ